MNKLVLFTTTIIVALFMSSCSDDEVSLTQNEIDDLQVLREEEKLARDVYLFSYDKYGEDIFNNIASSEQKHMNKILTLLNKYNLDDPALANRGEFTNQTLQGLYDDLTAQSDISLIEALKVGATIEDLDINDIDDFISRTDNSDILAAYNKLNCGSRNHMRSYYGKLIENDITYDPQFISNNQLESIISSSNEQCG
ncbi:MAG TPA: DUF2202 domain-containing protein, partial [Flavobacteriaceae bacterium]|nr:DUF2202 domain-containing protein [Flavobacteriaceae bacterium]